MEKAMKGREILTRLEPRLPFKDNFVLICSSCKRVKDKEGYWKDLDGFWKVADKLFSHGLCPRCAERYSAEIMELVRAST